MENKHQAYELAQMQSLPLSAKIQMTKQRIRGWYDYWDGQVYVSISGGKDSQVLAHLVKEDYPDVPLVFVNTGLEFDSVRIKGTELADEVLRPSMDFVSVIKKYGYPIISKEVSQAVDEARRFVKSLTDRQTIPYAYRIADFYGIDRRINKENELYQDLKQGNIPNVPIKTQQLLGVESEHFTKAYDKSKYLYLIDAPFRISNRCCDVMKKRPAHKYAKESGRVPFIGTMADESRLRKSNWIKYGCNGFEQKHPSSKPISFWTEQDILHYIKDNNLKIAEIYKDIAYIDDDGMVYDNDWFSDVMPLTTTGAKRTGCVFCMFGIGQETDRFLKLKEAEP